MSNAMYRFLAIRSEVDDRRNAAPEGFTIDQSVLDEQERLRIRQDRVEELLKEIRDHLGLPPIQINPYADKRPQPPQEPLH